MYLSSYIQVPDNPGKIVRRKKGENIYVLYEVARVYDPKRQFNVPKRVVIGKLASDAVDAIGICQDTSKKLVRSLFTPEEPQQGLCPYASLPQDIF